MSNHIASRSFTGFLKKVRLSRQKITQGLKPYRFSAIYGTLRLRSGQALEAVP